MRQEKFLKWNKGRVRKAEGEWIGDALVMSNKGIVESDIAESEYRMPWRQEIKVILDQNN